MNIDYEEKESIRLKVAQQLGWSHFEFSREGLLVGRVWGKKSPKLRL